MGRAHSTFSKLVNLYPLTKTLRFELKPVGDTQRFLEEDNVFQIDKVILDKYLKTKLYFDRLHRDFVQDALKDFTFSNLVEYEKVLRSHISDRKNAKLKKELEKEVKKLRQRVVAAFNKTAKKWATERFPSLKNKDLKFLYEEGVFENVLLPLYGMDENGNYKEGTTEILKKVDKKTGEVLEEKEISIFEGWKGFTGYFTKFFETRRNFYKDDGTSTAIATRIVDNLRKCFENKWLLEKYPKEFLDAFDAQKISFLKNTEKFGSFVLQGKKGENGNLGTGIDEYNEIVGEIKKEINLFRQKNGVKIPYLKTLDKQILSPKEKFIEEIEDETGLKTELENLLMVGNKSVETLKKLFANFVNHNEKFNLEKVYWSKKGFETVSRKYSTDSYKWEEFLAEILRKNGEKMVKQKDKGYKFPNFIKLSHLKQSLEKIAEDFSGEEVFWKEKYNQKGTTKANIWSQFLQIFWQEFSELLQTEKERDGEKKTEGYEIFAQNLSKKLQKETLKKTEALTAIIKLFADSLLRIYQISKYFSLEYKNRWNTENLDTDDNFYGEYYDYFFAESYEKIVQPYNRLRNYLTKKPWEEVQKWKLNFSNPTLAKGWDKNKEADNTAVILRKDKKYFLGVMKKSGGANQMFTEKNKEKFVGKGYEKMVYKLLPGANKMLPKVFFSASNIDFFNPSEKVLEIRNHASYSKNGTPQKGFEKKDFSLADCHILIDFFKEALQKHPDWKHFNFHFLPTEEYQDISGFYRDVEQGGYKISWENVSEEYITEKNQSGELYLFQIKNKDWNEKASGRKNLHTIYFENLFSVENKTENFPLKMNGEAELFHRPKAIEVKKVNRAKKNKDSSHDIIEKKRYTRDKSFFHLPVTFNRNAGSKTPFQFNKKINEFLANNPDIKILGIDRGEKHLAYYSLIDQKGNTVLDEDGKPLSGSLNIIHNKDYHYELEKRAQNREEQRKNWQAVEEIKDLKKGYISQVVHKLATLAIEHNAIIVFEDLNMRFKQIRGGIEKSAYQQLEKALLDKLSFCVDKKKKANESGGVLKAYQLTAPVEAFKDMGKQTGIIFYTQASYTSKIDPVTGWRPHLYLKYESVEKTSKRLRDVFDAIEWNAEKHRFEFVYTYHLKQWRVCSNVERWRGYRSEKTNNQWDYEKFPAEGEGSITQELLKLFEKENISVDANILNTVCESHSKNLLKNIVQYFRLICQIRNTDGDLHKKIAKAKDKGEETYKQIPEEEKYNEDFILSPVEPFFDSRKANEFGKSFPKNGDENGAYNIARKGLILLERISEWAAVSENEGSTIMPDLFISDRQWDDFAITVAEEVSPW